MLGSLGAVLYGPTLTREYMPSEQLLSVPRLTKQQQQQHEQHENNNNDDDDNPIRYYIYPEDDISGRLTAMTYAMTAKRNSHPFNCCRDPLSELAVHQALERHELRTMDPNEATFFIVPTQISSIMSWGCFNTDKNCTDYDEAFDALTSHPLFIKDDYGKHHIIISLNYLAFTQKHSQNMTTPLSRNYPQLKNTIVANRFDPMETYKIFTEKRAVGHDFENFFPKEGPLVTRAGFCVGSGLETYIPLIKATMERWLSSKYFVFYRTRKRGEFGEFHYNSDRYRHGPLTVAEKLQPSSIGYDLSKQEWLEHFSSSKFCLVIRGDTPESHAFFHAIRHGCLPVIISNFFPDFAGPFKASLDMRDFSIMLDEEEFIKDPLKSLQGLHDIDESVIESKINSMEYAQRIIFPDHPESEFVPAFLKEAMNALKLADEMKTDELMPY